MAERHKPGIAVLASGSGSTVEAFIHASQEGIVDAEVGLVISDKEDAAVFGRVARLNSLYNLDIQTRVINGELYKKGRQPRGQTLEEASEICRVVSTGEFSLVALMGYMRIVAENGDLMKEFGWLPEYAAKELASQGIYLARMLNTHPGILPATADTYGIHTQERVLELGLTVTAHTVHAVAPGVDAGPIFAQNEVPVFPGKDTPRKLFGRVQRVEKAHLPIDIDRFLKEQHDFHGVV
ncbi:MAG TPA: formyltransferase family protein [Patescibacteria group bacterium]|nr:formyltransferase family protein [Patescibacteria group bacterium]